MMQAASADDEAESPNGEASEVSAGVARWDFDSLYQAKYSDMVRLAYFLTGSIAQAEEATQDSFVRLYEQWSKVANHPAYLRMSVVNRCRSWHRSRFVASRVSPRPPRRPSRSSRRNHRRLGQAAATTARGHRLALLRRARIGRHRQLARDLRRHRQVNPPSRPQRTQRSPP